MTDANQGRYLANVAPGNEASHKLFAKLGGRVIQYTFELNVPVSPNIHLMPKSGASS